MTCVRYIIFYPTGVRDLYQRTRTSGSSSSDIQDLATSEGGGEVSRKKLCINFLQSIDQTGQYEPLYSSSLYDPIKAERAFRLDAMTQVKLSMNKQLEFVIVASH